MLQRQELVFLKFKDQIDFETGKISITPKDLADAIRPVMKGTSATNETTVQKTCNDAMRHLILFLWLLDSQKTGMTCQQFLDFIESKNYKTPDAKATKVAEAKSLLYVSKTQKDGTKKTTRLKMSDVCPRQTIGRMNRFCKLTQPDDAKALRIFLSGLKDSNFATMKMVPFLITSTGTRSTVSEIPDDAFDIE